MNKIIGRVARYIISHLREHDHQFHRLSDEALRQELQISEMEKVIDKAYERIDKLLPDIPVPVPYVSCEIYRDIEVPEFRFLTFVGPTYPDTYISLGEDSIEALRRDDWLIQRVAKNLAVKACENIEKEAADTIRKALAK